MYLFRDLNSKCVWVSLQFPENSDKNGEFLGKECRKNQIFRPQRIKTAKINVYLQDEREKFWHDESARKSITEKKTAVMMECISSWNTLFKMWDEWREN